jgi:hypothetical protein
MRRYFALYSIATICPSTKFYLPITSSCVIILVFDLCRTVEDEENDDVDDLPNEDFYGIDDLPNEDFYGIDDLSDEVEVEPDLKHNKISIIYIWKIFHLSNVSSYIHYSRIIFSLLIELNRSVVYLFHYD